MRGIIFKFIAFIGVITTVFGSGFAHDPAHKSGEARYIANEGVMVTQTTADGVVKILFDPLPLSGFGTYPDVPAKDKAAIMAGTAPYDGITAVFISHAHRDHFSAADMNAYLAAQADVKLFAPEQAVRMMLSEESWQEGFKERVAPIRLEFNQTMRPVTVGPLKVDAARIPHSGWPGRADIENIVFRVTLGDNITVAHMGDADIDPAHYTTFKSHWDTKDTDLAFPPYWIYLDPDGDEVLEIMNARDSVGIHVPIKIPADLKASGADFFSLSGETRTILPSRESFGGCAPMNFDAADFTVCRYAKSADIRLFWGKDGAPFGHFDDLAAHIESEGKELVMATNGGMYHSDRRPVGYFLENGTKLQELSTKASSGNFGLVPNGVFYIKDDVIEVRETKAFAAMNVSPDSATQSGPMLVIDGALHPKFRKDSDSRKRRNGVGVDDDFVYFAISEEPVNFHHFARLFRDGLGTPNALYMDGVVSRLYDADNSRNDGGFRMGPIVGVVRD